MNWRSQETHLPDSRRSGTSRVVLSLMPPLVCLLTTLYFSNFEDGRQFIARMSVFLPFALLAVMNPKWALGMALVTCGWFEWPTLAFGLRNQFLLDGVILGVACGLLLKSAWSKHKHKDKHREADHGSSSILLDPFFLTLAILSFVAILYCAAAQGALALMGGQGLRWLRAMQEWSFLWDEANSPVHSEMIVVGWLSYMITIWIVSQICVGSKISLKYLTGCLSGGMIPVIVIGTFQYQDPWCVFRNSFSVDTGGTFQNGNHLAFYCGVVALVLAASILFNSRTTADAGAISRPSKLWSSYQLVSFIAAMWGMYIGLGETAQVAFVFALMTLIGCSLMWSPKVISTGKGRIVKIASLGRVMVWISASSCVAAALIEIPIALGLSRFVPTALSQVTSILESTGRKGLLAEASRVVMEHPWFGNGLGLFYRLSTAKLPQHNLWLAITSEMGIPVFFLVAIAIALTSGFALNSLAKARSSPKNRERVVPSVIWLAIPLLVYFFLCSLMDTFLSYRSLGFAFLVPLRMSLCCLASNSPTDHDRIRHIWIRSLFACLFFGAAYGVSAGRNGELGKPDRRTAAPPIGKCLVLDWSSFAPENSRCRTKNTMFVHGKKPSQDYMILNSSGDGLFCWCNPSTEAKSDGQGEGLIVESVWSDCLGRPIEHLNESLASTVRLSEIGPALGCINLRLKED